MHLIDDVNAVASYLRRDPDLLGQGPDIIHRIVGGSIQFMDAVGAVLIEGKA
jgi:hypothetical protein